MRINQKGSGIVDYLLVTLVISAVAAPLIMKYFGEPIKETLYDNRESLVSFIGQDRKEVVPNEWFSAEETGAMPDPADIPPTPDIGEQNPPDPADVPDTPNFEEGMGTEVPGPPDIKPAKVPNPPMIKSPGKFSGGAGGGRRGGGSQVGGSGAWGGLGGSAVSSGGLNDKFFDSQGGGGGKQGSSKAGGGRTYGDASGGTTAEMVLGGKGGGGGAKKKGGENSAKESSPEGATIAKRNQGAALLKLQHDDIQDAKDFDWWLILKLIVVGLIIFLLAIIALNSLKSTSN